MTFLAWTKIQQVSGVVKELNHRFAHALTSLNLPIPSTLISFRLKPKLHGTNAGVGLTNDNELLIQSRGRLITPSDDNAGFAKWVMENEEYFRSILPRNGVLFGEWAGRGIMHGAAICQIDKKIFAPFAWVPYDIEENLHTEVVIVEPIALWWLVGEHVDIRVIPWVGETFALSYTDSVSRADFQQSLEAAVLQWEENDEWVESVFDVRGVGEGFVGYPVTESGKLSSHQLDRQLFKAKGTKHSKSKVKKVASVDVEQVRSQTEFAETFVTPARCQQGIDEACEGVLDIKLTGKFIGWMCKDVFDESKNEVEASGYTWKQLSPGVVNAARGWWMEQIRAL